MRGKPVGDRMGLRRRHQAAMPMTAAVVSVLKQQLDGTTADREPHGYASGAAGRMDRPIRGVVGDRFTLPDDLPTATALRAMRQRFALVIEDVSCVPLH